MQHSREIPASPNLDVADRLDEVARIFAQQGANRFRVRAYRHAAGVLRGWPRSVADIFAEEGIEGLGRFRASGRALRARFATFFCTAARHARPAARRRRSGCILASVPGIGKIFAARLHDDLGIETLEELEVAAHDGRLKSYPGIGAKRLAGIRDSLAQRLRRVRRELAASPPRQPPVSELLDVDREYREKAAAGILTKVAPRRFNPERRSLASHSPHRAEAASLHRGFLQHRTRPRTRQDARLGRSLLR